MIEPSLAFYTTEVTRYDRCFVSESVSLPQSVLILTDESANWKVAGLRQIDRTALALNQFSASAGFVQPLPVCIQRASISVSRASQLANIAVTADPNSLPSGDVLVLSTRLVLARRTLGDIFENREKQMRFPALIVAHKEITEASLDPIAERLRAAERTAAERGEFILRTPDGIGDCAKNLFQSTGKSQDGLISRYLNRPLSRNLSRLMVRLPLSPNQWTLLLMALPIAGAIFLLRGDYLGFAVGALFFQLHSALDGCDGEIARVKYLESKAGSKLDGVCDRISTLMFAISLGFGLSRLPGNSDLLRWFYPIEGVVAALFIGVTETLLTRGNIDDGGEAAGSRYGDFVAENRQTFNQGDQLKLWMIKHSGMLSVGNRITSFFGELTKRDVFNFVFMLLAVCGLPQWVLHILALCACLIVALGIKDMLAPTIDVNSAA